MKKLVFLISLLIISLQAFSQTRLTQLDTIVVGQTQVWRSIDDLPVALFVNYSYNQMIYYADEIRRPMVITKIGFQLYASTFNDSHIWNFYMGLTDKQQFENDSDYIAVDSVAAPVFYDAYSTYKDLLWFSVPEFQYKGDSNLVIAVYDKSYGTEDYPSYFLGYKHQTGKAKAIRYPSPNQIDVNNLPSGAILNNIYLPQLYLIGYPLAYQTDTALMEILTDSVVGTDDPISLDVQIRNHGTDQLTSVTINWQVENLSGNVVSSGSYNWQGNLATNQRQNVNIGSVSLPQGQYWLTVYLSNPNGTNDQFPASDTLRKKLYVSPGCKHSFVLSIKPTLIKTGTLSVYIGDSLFYYDLDVFHLNQIEYPVIAPTNDTVIIKYNVYSSSYVYQMLSWQLYDNKGNLVIDDYVYNTYVVDTGIVQCKLDYDLSVKSTKLGNFDFILQDYQYTPVVQIKNIGKQPASNFDVTLKITLNDNIVYNQTVTVTDTLYTDETYDLQFNQNFSALDTGLVKTYATVTFTNDQDNTNNSDTTLYDVLPKATLNTAKLFSFAGNKLFAIDTNYSSYTQLDTVLLPSGTTMSSLTVYGQNYNNFYLLGLTNTDQVVIFNAEGKNKILPEYLVDGRTVLSSKELKYDIANDQFWLLITNSDGVNQLALYDLSTNSAKAVYTQDASVPLTYATNFEFFGDGSVIYVDNYGNFYRLDSINDPNRKELFTISYTGYPYQADIAIDRYTGMIYLWRPAIFSGYYFPILYKYNWITNKLDSIGFDQISFNALAFADKPGYKLPVKIVDKTTGNPIAYAGFRVELMPWKTDASGTRTVYLPDGSYTITAYAKGYDTIIATAQINGQDADTLVIQLSKSIANIAYITPRIKVYPNPATDYIKIYSSQIINSVEIQTIDGRVILRYHPNNDNFRVNVSYLSTGVYLLTLKASNFVYTKKILVIR